MIWFLLLGLCLWVEPAQAQEVHRDSLRQYEMSPVVISATRTARALQDVPVPTTVIPLAQIELRGALRLSDLLAEQPGIALFEGIYGQGVQLQGLDPEYTLILIDGEPIIGRSAGLIDLDRVAITEIDRVEIVRGPTSSRYGSDALAGVINLVTKRPQAGFRGRVGMRAESFEVERLTLSTTNLSTQFEGGSERASVRVLFNRLASQGFEIDPRVQDGPRSPSFSDYTSEVRASLRPSDRFSVDVLGRVLHESHESRVQIFGLTADDAGERTEFTLAPSFRYQFAPAWRAHVRLYGADFSSRLRIFNAGETIDDSRFRQQYGKAEAEIAYLPAANRGLYFGVGGLLDVVGGDRFGGNDIETRQGFLYSEMEWMPSRKVDVVVSSRFDANSDYANRFTPKAAVLYRPSENIRFRGSVGSGYKAPALRQLYFDFTNTTASYTVFGAQEARQRLERLEAEGAITEFLLPIERIGRLSAESSVSYGMGTEVRLFDALSLQLNAFHNEVRDLIEFQPVALLSSGRQVFTYFNLDRIYTRGIDSEASFAAGRGITLGASYQWLDSGDRDITRAIDEGTQFGRRDNGREYRLRRSDYGGLFGRSRHSATGRVEFEDSERGLAMSLRVVWRGQFGFRDRDGNGILNRADEYAPGFALVNATATKAFGQTRVHLGVRNLTNYRDADHLPSLTGRTVFVGAGYRF